MLRPYSNKQAFSLLETLISAALVLLVLGLGAKLLLPLLRMQVEGSERAEVQQRVSLLLEELRRDLAATTGSGVSLYQKPDELLLAIHRADDLAQDGTLVWQDQAVVYQWRQSSQTWSRSVWKDPQRRRLRASAPTRLSEDELRIIAGQVGQSPGRSYAGIGQFSLGGAVPQGVVNLPITVTITALAPSGEARQSVRVLAGRLPGP